MNYIERVLPSLGEDSVTLRSIGAVASDVVRITGDRADRSGDRRDQGQPADGQGAAPAGPRAAAGGAAGAAADPQGPRAGAAGPARWSGSAPRCSPTTSSTTGREAAEKALLDRPVARLRPAELDLERDEFDGVRRQVADLAAFKMFGTRGGRRVSAPAALARLADPALLRPGRRIDAVRRPSSELLSAELPTDAPAPRTGPRPTARCWTSWCTCSDRCPRPRTQEVSLFLDEDSEFTEVVTTADRLAAGARGRSVRACRTRPTRTSSSTRRRTSRPCSGGCCAGAAPAPAGPSSAILRRAPGPTADEADRAIEEIIGTAPVRRFRMSTNYRSPAEVFDLAAKVVVADFPDADLPAAVRSTGIQPRALSADGRGHRGSDDSGGHDQHRALAARRGRRHGRRDLSARPPRAELAAELEQAQSGRRGAARGGHPAAVEGPGVRRRAGGHPR